MNGRGFRRALGVTMLLSAVVLGLFAGLFYWGVIGIPLESQALLVAVLVVAAAADAVIGLRLLSEC